MNFNYSRRNNLLMRSTVISSIPEREFSKVSRHLYAVARRRLFYVTPRVNARKLARASARGYNGPLAPDDATSIPRRVNPD